ncbi:hypothetical protein M5V91_09580 [Cytobacillus pseudoceanisediminis]|uniref:hypothetical protein n=1 Tax=Cytobacillus pseudoceanisediminis TaxID=3051614 RepID=UPI002187CD10|nr:hypothetical protein [Cytobacillus pseudoceanisediminis]UQX55863.1 hypothetical protein M5V91_09580 [Cytobacillus pseudoceanisediminis]
METPKKFYESFKKARKFPAGNKAKKASGLLKGKNQELKQTSSNGKKKSMFRELRVPLNPDAGAAAAVNQKFDFYNKNVVYINRSVLNEIINHCREDLPYEACGLLSGQHGRNEMMWKIRSTEKVRLLLQWI